MTKICIRAGHGQDKAGRGDPGCTGGGLKEDDITLLAALALNNAIKDTFKTCVPRADDNWQDTAGGHLVGLPKAVNIAKQAGCNVFLSIHVNAAGSPAANGAEAIVRPGDKAAHALATDLLSAHCQIFGIKNRGIKERCADLYEMRETKAMDTVLLELGFISNEADLKALKRFVDDREMRISWSNALRVVFKKHYK